MLFTLCESMMPLNANDDDDDDVKREGIGISIYPIMAAQWEALQDAAATRGISRSELIRAAITFLLDERDRDSDERYTYPSAPKLTPQEKADTNPRTVWLKEPLLARMQQRCIDDRVHQSELCLEALRRYLDAEGIDIDPPL